MLLLFTDDPARARSQAWLGLAVGLGSLLGLVVLTMVLLQGRE